MRVSKPSLTVPTLMSERLKLEPLTRAHSGGMFARWSQAEVCRYSGPAFDVDGQPSALPAVTASDSNKVVDFFLDGAAFGERFRWAGLTKAERRLIGAIGFNTLGACSEIAFHLHPAYWGHAYVAEASLASLQWLRSEPARKIVEAFIAPANVRSIKLSTRLVLRRTGDGRGPL